MASQIATAKVKSKKHSALGDAEQADDDLPSIEDMMPHADEGEEDQFVYEDAAVEEQIELKQTKASAKKLAKTKGVLDKHIDDTLDEEDQIVDMVVASSMVDVPVGGPLGDTTDVKPAVETELGEFLKQWKDNFAQGHRILTSRKDAIAALVGVMGGLA